MESLFIEPFRADFMQTGLLAAAVVGVLCGVVGCFVLIRGMALMSDAVAHGVVPGIAVAFLLTAGTAGEDPSRAAILLGALAGGALTAAGTSVILRRTSLRPDTATAVVFVFMLALGVVVISGSDDYTVDLTSFLFGDVLAVPSSEVPISAGITALVLAAVAVLYRPLVLLCFDRRRAVAAGLPVERLELALLALLTLAVVIGFRIVGALLVLGMLMAPPAAASLLTRRLPAMMAVSSGIAVVSAPLGLLLSWHLDTAAGASIVLVAVGFFVLALILRPSRTIRA